MGFKVGDVVRRKNGGVFSNGSKQVTIERIGPILYGANQDGFWFKETGTNTSIQEAIKAGGSYELEKVKYEDGWVLNDGIAQIPPDAKTLKDEEGDVVAFKRVKEPVVREYKRYYGFSGDCFLDKRLYTHATVIFTEIDGVLDSVRLEKE